MEEQTDRQLAIFKEIFPNGEISQNFMEERRNEIMKTHLELCSTVQSFLQNQQQSKNSIENLIKNQKNMLSRVDVKSLAKIKSEASDDEIEAPQNVLSKLKKKESFSSISTRLCRYSDQKCQGKNEKKKTSNN